MGSRPSFLARWLEPFISGLWIFFLLCTTWIACVWTFGIGDSSLDMWIVNRELRAVLVWLISVGDIAWITLAAATVHLWLAETEGLPTARRWALIVVLGVTALGAFSTLAGWPLGAIHYSDRLGVRLGPVPVGLPLLWYALIVSARQTVLRCWPSAAPWPLALSTGALALLANVNLEPVAAKLRAFWFWRMADPTQPPFFTPPWTNYAAWFLLAISLAFLLREDRMAVNPHRTGFRPVWVYLLLNAVFFAANLGRFLRG